MAIEDYNRLITQCRAFRIERNETIRGGINLELLDRLRDYWRLHGCPSNEQIENSKKKIRLCK